MFLRLVTISYDLSHLPSMTYTNNNHVYLPFTAESVIICGVLIHTTVAGGLTSSCSLSVSVTSVHTAACVERGLQGVPHYHGLFSTSTFILFRKKGLISHPLFIYRPPFSPYAPPSLSTL